MLELNLKPTIEIKEIKATFLDVGLAYIEAITQQKLPPPCLAKLLLMVTRANFGHRAAFQNSDNATSLFFGFVE